MPRNRIYICYINGQLVGILRDASALYGLLGIYLGDTKATAAFSDFTVYPV